jgi:hypothetical protein
VVDRHFWCDMKKLKKKKTLVEIMNNIKIYQYQIYYGMHYGYKVWFNGFEYTKTCCFVHLKQNGEI